MGKVSRIYFRLFAVSLFLGFHYCLLCSADAEASNRSGLKRIKESETTLDDVARYIAKEWEASVRINVREPYIVPIPFAHTVPSPAGNFKALFYWDTYFTNIGLIHSSRVDLAKSNCDALLWWIDEKGFVPNSAFVGDDNRSQPPLLAAMVRDVFEITGDREWLGRAVPRLVKEYEFWIRERSFPDGLAHFGHHADAEYLMRFYGGTLHSRLGFSLDVPDAEKLAIAGNLLAEAESGTDFSPVYGDRALEFADVKLNSILFVAENDIAFLKRALGVAESEVMLWESRARLRGELVRSRLWNRETKLFCSRNETTGEFAKIPSLDTFFPLWAGLATREQAAEVVGNLKLFEVQHGLAHTAEYQGPRQWAFPNVWPPSQLIAVRGMLHYGYSIDAKRVAGKYCEAQRAMYSESGHLWEKYDGLTGKPAGGEYAADPMLGWTAGVFLDLQLQVDGRPEVK